MSEKLSMASDNNIIKVKLLTYNVWFNKFALPERLAAIGRIIEDENPDIIGLQEVTPNMVPTIQQQPWFKRYRGCTDMGNTAQGIGRYGTVLLSRHGFQQRVVRPFQMSNMDRKLVFGSCKLSAGDSDGPTIAVVTSHLESLSGDFNQRTRESQIDEIVRQLQPFPVAVFMGDTNFVNPSESAPEFVPKSLQDAGFVDLWPSDQEGFTYDANLNIMITYGFRSRLDRIYLKTPFPYSKKIYMVGTEPIKASTATTATTTTTTTVNNNGYSPPQPRDIFPSDHFGLVCELELTLPTTTTTYK